MHCTDAEQRLQERVAALVDWLRTQGSPASRIDRADISPPTQIEAPQFTSFEIRR